MKLYFNYGSEVVSLPAAAIRDKLAEASSVELKLLLGLCADPALRENYGEKADGFAASLGCTRRELDRALEYWRSAGAVSAEAEEGEAESKQVSERRRGAYVPQYTGKEAEAIINEGGLASVVDECSRLLGRTFNPTDVNSIIAIYQDLGVESAYITMLCDYCARIDKRSIAYVRKRAYDLYDGGVDSLEKLDSYIRAHEALFDYEGELRRIFGIAGRALTAKENACFEKWCKWGYSSDVVKRAYDVTVEKTGKYTISYLDRVLANWHEAGYRTIGDVDQAEKRYAEEKEKRDPANEGSFQTDEFFEAALRRSRENAIKLIDEKKK